jgi:Ferritin-like domain
VCAAYAEEIANNEIAHVKFLQTALGNASVECPALDIGEAFSIAADVAVNATLSPKYSPYYDDKWFLLGAFIFEGESREDAHVLLACSSNILLLLLVCSGKDTCCQFLRLVTNTAVTFTWQNRCGCDCLQRCSTTA